MVTTIAKRSLLFSRHLLRKNRVTPTLVTPLFFFTSSYHTIMQSFIQIYLQYFRHTVQLDRQTWSLLEQMAECLHNS